MAGMDIKTRPERRSKMQNRMKQIRKELDLTQQEFAKRIGSTQNVLANYETGRRNPSSSVINNICKEFSVNETWFRTGKGQMFDKINRDNQLMMWAGKLLSEEQTSYKKRLLTVLMSLSEDEWLLLEKITNGLVLSGEQKPAFHCKKD